MYLQSAQDSHFVHADVLLLLERYINLKITKTQKTQKKGPIIIMKKKVYSLLLALLMAASSASMWACEKEEITEKETSVSETVASETDALETDAPETDALETDASETDSPETDASESESPYPVETLTINGIDIGEYVIVTNSQAGGVMTYAAEELQKYIRLTTGDLLPIKEEATEGMPRILIDETTVDDDERMVISNDENGIVISGSARRSALYGVYHFLENCLGWRFFASDTEVCHDAQQIDLTDVSIDYTIPYEIRGIYEKDYHNKYISVKRYQNEEGQRRMTQEEKLGFDEVYCANGIHTFGPLNESGDGYADPQPCLNDTEVRNRMLNNIRTYLDENWRAGINENRDIKAIHVSQNDNTKYCTCADCMADIEYYGSPAGSIIEFVNWVAEDLETYNDGKYKDVYVMTFAYQYSLDCPENIVCHDKVMIQFALIDMCYQHALTDPTCKGATEVTPNYELPIRSNVEILAEIEKWKEICSHFFLWDYATNFRYYLSATPNFDILLENYRYFNEIGLWGYVSQANNATSSADFGVLRSYLIAKITEDPDMTEEEYNDHINEFLRAYYGEGAWEYVREYFDYLHTLSNANDMCYGVYNSPEQIYGKLNDETNPDTFINKSEWLVELFDNALAADGLTETQVTHIRQLRTSCEYLRLGAIHQRETTSEDYERVKAQRAAIRDFYFDLTILGQTRVTENVELPATVNYADNPRTWINNTTIHWYSE